MSSLNPCADFPKRGPIRACPHGTVPCPLDAVSGFKTWGPHKCPICDGTGETYPPADMQTTAASKIPCRACGGTGIVWG